MDSIGCSGVRAILPLAAAREIGWRQRQRLRDHLRDCTACAQLAKGYEETWIRLDDWPDEPKPYVADHVVRALTILRPPVWRLSIVHAAIQMAAGIAWSVAVAFWLAGIPSDLTKPAPAMAGILAWMAGIANAYIFVIANDTRHSQWRRCYYLTAFGALGALALYALAAKLCPPHVIAEALLQWPGNGQAEVSEVARIDAHMSMNTFYCFFPALASGWFVGERMPRHPENLGWTLGIVFGALALPSLALQYEAFSETEAWCAGIGAAMGALTGGPIGMWIGIQDRFEDL